MDGEREKFYRDLREFQGANQICLRRDASLCDEPVDMFLLFNIVLSRGGFANVTRERKWTAVAYECCGIENNKRASSRLKTIYTERLFRFETEYKAAPPPASTSADLTDHADYIQLDSDDGGQEDMLRAVEAALGNAMSEEAYSILTSGQWLLDDHINDYLSLIASYCNSNSALPNVYALSTHFYVALTAPHVNIHRWTRTVNLFSFNFIFIPLHINMNHWAMAVVNIDKQTLSLYDSMREKVNGRGGVYLQNLLNYLKAEHEIKHQSPLPSTWRINPTGQTEDTVLTDGRIPNQENGDDCGVFTCMFAKHIAIKKPFTFKQADIQLIRLQMEREFRTGRLESESVSATSPALPDTIQSESKSKSQPFAADEKIPKCKNKVPLTRDKNRIPLKSQNIVLQTREQLICSLIHNITSEMTVAEFLSEINRIDRSSFLRYYVRTCDLYYAIPRNDVETGTSYQSLLKSAKKPDQGDPMPRSKLDILRNLAAKDHEFSIQIMKQEAAIKRYKLVKKDVQSLESILDESKLFHLYVKKLIERVKKGRE